MLTATLKQTTPYGFKPVHSRYERRSVAILSSDQAAMIPAGSVLPELGRGVTFYTRARVVDLVLRREMRWVDKHRNGATWTEKAAGTWQKTRSGAVHTMQLKVGFKGRHVPATQAETIEMPVSAL